MELQSLLLLLIEPSRTQRHIIKNNLISLGLEAIEEFENAQDALERMQSVKPDIVMSSMHLPDMSGSELVTEMRKSNTLHDVIFFLITSETLYRYIEPIRQSGAAVILPKPFELEELKKMLMGALTYINDSQDGVEKSEDDLEDLWVLVVDDSITSRHFVQRTLTSLGIVNCREAKDGAEALQIMKTQHFDLIITDYNMPNIDGLELVEHIRHYSDQPTIPILVVTSEQNQESLAQFKSAGATAICQKPVSYESLKGLLHHLFLT